MITRFWLPRVCACVCLLLCVAACAPLPPPTPTDTAESLIMWLFTITTYALVASNIRDRHHHQ